MIIGVEQFIADLTAATRKHGITLKLAKGKTVRVPPGIQCAGYFDGDHLVVATGGKPEDWLRILVHESCHMDQCLSNSKFWREATDENYEKFDFFLGGTRCRDMIAVMDSIVRVEADCERRAIKKIIKYKLPIDVESYAQGANAYLLSHKAILLYQRWYKRPLSSRMDIVKTMPKVIGTPASYTMHRNRVDPEIFKPWFE